MSMWCVIFWENYRQFSCTFSYFCISNDGRNIIIAPQVKISILEYVDKIWYS